MLASVFVSALRQRFNSSDDDDDVVSMAYLYSGYELPDTLTYDYASIRYVTYCRPNPILQYSVEHNGSLSSYIPYCHYYGSEDRVDTLVLLPRRF
jgi:hypothetical protein